MSYFYKKEYMKIKKGKKKFTFFMEINMNDSFTRILWDRVALRYFKVLKQTTEDGYKKLEVKAKTIESLKSYLKKHTEIYCPIKNLIKFMLMDKPQ